MRKEVKKMHKYSEQIRFICKYKLEIINDVENLKKQKKEELQKNLNARNRLYYKRQKLDDESKKDVITKEIINVTAAIEKIRKEINLCDEIGDKSRNMKEQIKEMKEKEQEKIKEKKKKDRKCER